LYTDDEIRLLLKTSLGLSPTDALRRWTYYSLLGLLAVSGLRISEALSLRLSDVDLQDAVLTIHGTKFGKSRLAPLHPSAQRVLSRYKSRRNQYLNGRTASDFFFVTKRGTKLDKNNVRRTFHALSRQTGLRGQSIVGDRACTTSVTDSPFKLFCTGIVPATMSRDFFPFFPLISDTSVRMTRTGI
jgi:integrase